MALLFLYLAASPAGCHDKYVQPDLPPHLTDAQKTEAMKEWNDGEMLFKTNCSQCHGIFTKGKDSIPNFTKVQMDKYASRFLAMDPKNHAVIRQIAPQDFFKITFFLAHLQKNSHISPQPAPPDHKHNRPGFPRGF